jgi:hypothetical protein
VLSGAATRKDAERTTARVYGCEAGGQLLATGAKRSMHLTVPRASRGHLGRRRVPVHHMHWSRALVELADSGTAACTWERRLRATTEGLMR